MSICRSSLRNRPFPLFYYNQYVTEQVRIYGYYMPNNLGVIDIKCSKLYVIWMEIVKDWKHFATEYLHFFTENDAKQCQFYDPV